MVVITQFKWEGVEGGGSAVLAEKKVVIRKFFGVYILVELFTKKKLMVSVLGPFLP